MQPDRSERFSDHVDGRSGDGESDVHHASEGGQTGLLRASICAHARNSVAVKLPVRTVPVLEIVEIRFRAWYS